MAIDPNIWLDAVRAVPSIGLRAERSFETGSALLGKMRPLLIRWSNAHKLKVSVEKEFNVHIERDDGIDINVSHDAIVCKFFYISTLVEKGEKQARLKYNIEPKPYRQLLEMVRECLFEVVAELSKEGNRTFDRVGVVADGTLDKDALPPGVERFVRHIGSPWDSNISILQTRITADLNEIDSSIDRCHHMFKWDKEEDNVMEFTIDWQRYLKTGLTPSPPRLKRFVSDGVDSALAYFGRFGLGELNYGAD